MADSVSAQIKYINLWIAITLIALAVIARWLPHPPNVAPIAAIALLGGAVLPRRLALSLPLAAMIISDLLIGLHSLILFTWGSFGLIALFSSYVLPRRQSVTWLLGAALTSSLFFFIVTNFGVWMEGRLYPRTLAGLAEAYTLALPFFRNTIIGDLAYTGLLFGAFYLARAGARYLVVKPSSA